MFKLINNKSDCPYIMSYVGFHVPKHASRYVETFGLVIPRTNAMKNSQVSKISYFANIHFNDIFHVVHQL